MPLPIGSPVYLRYFDPRTGNYTPKHVGTLERVDGHRWLVSGRWRDVPNPAHAWGSEEEGRAYIEKHPFTTEPKDT